jgi:hypothetical protein
LTNLDPNGREWRKFAKAAGVETFVNALAARSPGLRNTLAIYDGPNAPDLKFAIVDLSANKDSDNGGTFSINPLKESDLTYDTAKMNQAGDIKEFLPFTGKFLTGPQNYTGGTIELSNKLDLRVVPKINAESARIVFHEFGHADLAGSNLVEYLKLTAQDVYGNIKVHDDRPAEKKATRRCQDSNLCPP